MDFRKAYHQVEWKRLREVTKTVYDVGSSLLKAEKLFDNGKTSVVIVGRYESDSFGMEVGVRQGCVMSS